MSKYAPLANHLRSLQQEEVSLSFADIESVLAFKLPTVAVTHRAWWANSRTDDSHTHAHLWIEAGWETVEVNLSERRVRFRKAVRSEPLAKDVTSPGETPRPRERLTASELYRITGEDIRRGISELRPNAPPRDFSESTRFDLLLDGHTRLPPKAVVGLAGQGPFGRILSSSEFSGGESSAAFRLLWDHGYEIATKRKKVGRLDATFSVGRGQDSLFLIVESRGPDRNTDYSEGLEALLWEMAHLSVTLADATVESSRTRHLPLDERRLHLASHTYPIRLAQVGDLGDLRADLMSTAAGTARTVESHGGGNPTKRIRLELKGAEEETLWELSEVLADGGGSQTPPVGTFNFQPGGGEWLIGYEHPPRDSSDTGVSRPSDDSGVLVRLSGRGAWRGPCGLGTPRCLRSASGYHGGTGRLVRHLRNQDIVVPASVYSGGAWTDPRIRILAGGAGGRDTVDRWSK